MTSLRAPHELAHSNFEMVVRRLADDIAFGTDDSLFVGSGLEYAESRPYEPGDSIRQMDWRMTARIGKPFVKQHETLKRVPIYLVVDTSASMAVSSTPLSKHDCAIWTAAAFGLIGIRRLSPVAIAGAGERVTRIEPSVATSDLWRCLEPLRTHSYDEGTRLAEQIVALKPRLRQTSLLIILSDFHDEDAAAAVRLVAQRHDVIAIQYIDPAEEGRLRAGFVRAREAETAQTMLMRSRTRLARREDLARDLTRAGVSHLPLRTDANIIPVLRQFLLTRAVRSRGAAG